MSLLSEGLNHRSPLSQSLSSSHWVSLRCFHLNTASTCQSHIEPIFHGRHKCFHLISVFISASQKPLSTGNLKEFFLMKSFYKFVPKKILLSCKVTGSDRHNACSKTKGVPTVKSDSRYLGFTHWYDELWWKIHCPDVENWPYRESSWKQWQVLILPLSQQWTRTAVFVKPSFLSRTGKMYSSVYWSNKSYYFCHESPTD